MSDDTRTYEYKPYFLDLKDAEEEVKTLIDDKFSEDPDLNVSDIQDELSNIINDAISYSTIDLICQAMEIHATMEDTEFDNKNMVDIAKEMLYKEYEKDLYKYSNEYLAKKQREQEEDDITSDLYSILDRDIYAYYYLPGKIVKVRIYEDRISVTCNDDGSNVTWHDDGTIHGLIPVEIDKSKGIDEQCKKRLNLKLRYLGCHIESGWY